MTGATLNISSNTASTAFRTWGGAISTALATAGLVQTSDTGQINWTTVTNPGTTSTAYGYEVWRFNDSLQSTKPLFFKLEYGAGAAAATPALWVTTGTATDGAGTMTSASGTGTSTTSRRTIGDTTQTLTAVTGNVYIGAPDSSCIGVLAWPGYSSTWGGMAFFIERTRDSDGTPNGNGYLFGSAKSLTGSAGTTTWDQRHFSGLPIPSQWTMGLCPFLNDSNFTSVSDGATLYPLPFMTGYTPRMGGPSKLLVGIGKGDVTANTTFSMTHYGGSRTWVSAGPGVTSGTGWGAWGNAGGNTSLTSFAMRID
jgi:hypothetical protein